MTQDPFEYQENRPSGDAATPAGPERQPEPAPAAWQGSAPTWVAAPHPGAPATPYAQDPYAPIPPPAPSYGTWPYAAGAPAGPPPAGTYSAPYSGPYSGPYGGPASGAAYPVPAHPARRAWTAGALALALVVSAALGFGVASRVRSAQSSTGASASQGGSPNAGGLVPRTGGAVPDNSTVSGQAASVAAKVDPGVVDVNTVLFAGGNAAGTGMILNSSGEILTNNHVVAGSSSIKATVVSTGRTYNATLVGTDAAHDVAVIQLQGASGLKTIPLGDSSTLTLGQAVVALGNALGAGGTPSVVEGTIQALDQTITAGDASGGTSEQLSGLIQTNAPLQPGDSGGPLATQEGKVIGMDTAASSSYRFRAASGASFAIPINAALSIAKQMEAGQASGTIHLGQSGFLGVEVDQGSTGGAIVVGVQPGTPAAGAGLAAGDVVTTVDGASVASGAALTSLLGGHHPGDKVSVRWTDGSGQSHTATVTLTTGPVQ